MKKYVVAIDQGTSSSRSIIFDKNGAIISQSQREIDMIYPRENAVEQKAYDIWTSVLTTLADSIMQAEIDILEIASIGITNQRETTVLWDKRTGEPIYNAIVWQSKQSDAICKDLINQGYEDLFKDKTGLLIDPYFSATKIKWVLEHVDGAQALMDKGQLMFGTVDTWLLYKLSGEKIHKTDHTNASRTLLYNIYEQQWDQELLDILGIDSAILPEVCASSSVFGSTTKQTFFGHEVPIAGILGDQQAALFGQKCFDKGTIKNTYGTGCFMLMNTGTSPVKSDKGLLTTIAYSIDNTLTYALEGSVFVAGSAIQWLRDELMFIEKASDSEQLANSVKDTNGVYVVPAFVGLGTPYWDSEAKGAIFGLTRSTSKAHITRATLDALAYQTKDIIDVMSNKSGIRPKFLKVDGGASNNDYLMQFQANILNTEIFRPDVNESTALGAAYISGLATNFFTSIKEIKDLNTTKKTFYPIMDDSTRANKYKKWQQAVAAARKFR
ncbi:MAG: glycerol kinase GlpK [Candidatus Izimaplasma sp.]|nr:glycerol kinase GlpK [Candidatus Izimaplasma bacterium]